MFDSFSETDIGAINYKITSRENVIMDNHAEVKVIGYIGMSPSQVKSASGVIGPGKQELVLNMIRHDDSRVLIKMMKK